LANANAGGENVARGSLLGALMGARHGMAKLTTWAKDGLKNKDEINTEINNLLQTLNQNEDLWCMIMIV